MSKVLRRGLAFSADVAPLVGHMTAVDEYREDLLRLQGVWDSLAMLGQMSGTVPDIAGTRSDFASLTGTLLDNLARCLLANAQGRLAAQAQVAIDILVRNLFERTADVGFLSTDSEVVAHAARWQTPTAAVPEDVRRPLEQRFREYVAKYSVYDDVAVLSPQGRVLARLDRRIASTACSEAWLQEALQGQGYVEHCGATALLDGRFGLVYAHAIRQEGRAVGVLALSFRFDNEMRAIFGQLLQADDATALVLIDAHRAVVASSDPWQFPLGAPLRSPQATRLRFAGRDYLACEAAATGYEGYNGPGWKALALQPSDAAFEDTADDTALTSLAARLDTRELFGAELLSIAPKARRIERDLSRLLWNGRLRRHGDGNAAFAATLLREVGHTGERMRQVFDQATGKLHRSTLSAVFDQARHHARLAIDIVDRNLYERANDCRWWALDGVLCDTLAQPAEQRDAAAAGQVLRRINGLYTVYSLLVLFDAGGTVVAVSDPNAAEWTGRQLDEPWVAETLALRDPALYAVSRHQPTSLYGGRATCVYGAALRHQGRVSGGIAIVFDGEPQFAAMLRDALPPGGRSTGLLLSHAGTVLASTDPRHAVGSTVPLPEGWASLSPGEARSVAMDLDGVVHAAGFALSGGYREYPVARPAVGDRMVSLVLTPLGARLDAPLATPKAFEPLPLSPKAQARTVAGLRVDGQWLGLPVDQVIEALEAPRIAALPNAPRHLLGMLPFEGRMLPLIDLGLLRGTSRPIGEEGPVIVATTAAGQRFALRVEALGPVFEADGEKLQSLQTPQATGERLVRGSSADMLTLLDAASLWQAAQGGADAGLA